MKVNELLKKLAAEEDVFLKSEFFSPVLRNKAIRVKIADIVMSLRVSKPRGFEGWGVFRPASYKLAEFVREPTMIERRTYFNLFPVLRLIATRRQDNRFWGIPANEGDSRFKIQGFVPILLPEELQLFDAVRVRFDGINCWFERIDDAHSIKHATVLRNALSENVAPKDVDFSSMSKEQRRAYDLALVDVVEAEKEAKRLAVEAEALTAEGRVKSAINRAGGGFRSFVERGESYTVEYVVDGETHRSTVDKKTLAVQSAGICLSGGDRNFDLQSLVGVIREGITGNQIYRVGGNYLDVDDRGTDDYTGDWSD